MGNDIEAFMCMISDTEYMKQLLFHNEKDIGLIPDVVEAIEIMSNFEQFKSIEDVKKINNKHIKEAIKELEK